MRDYSLAKKLILFYLLTFVLSFCSIVYELILAQSLTAFLENTVLRYSVVIGLYMCSMGFGALATEGSFVQNPLRGLVYIEILLSVFGGFSVIFLYLLDFLNLTRIIFEISAYGLIIIVGVLTGFELPLFIEILCSNQEQREHTILGINYAGALTGSILFAFVFYPIAGLIPTAFFLGLLNIFCGMVLFLQEDKPLHKSRSGIDGIWAALIILLVLFAVCWLCSGWISNFFINLYLK